VAVIAGLPGVGKTALAIRWAHQVGDRFPDGQVFLNLRGYDPDRPLTATEALARLLDALGFRESEIPPDLEQRAARYRTEIAGRRILLVLDNAASAQQVRPLLPGSPTCAAVVTSRDGLAGLVARDGAHRLDLGPLPDDDARALLRRLIGHRADAEPDALATLANQCGRLPLALRLAAEMAVSRPAIALAHLVAELADQDRPLRPLLDGGGGDPWAAVSTVFSWSVRHLPPGPALLFRRLGLHPGPDLDAHAAAALAGSDVAAARQALDALAHAHLVDRVGADRFGRHDLLRAYAVELAAADPDTAGRTAALDRQYGYYLAAAAAAMQRLHPAEAHLRPQPPAVTTALPKLADADAARAWLDAERPVLVALAGKAATGEQPGFAVLVSATLHRYLDGGYHTDALAIHEHARAAARRVGDSGGEAQAELGLGIVAYRLGRLPAAVDRLRPALAVFDRIGDLMGQARALSVLGTVAQRQGRYRSATDHHEHALELFRRLDDRAGVARALNNLGLVERLAGRFELATEHHRRALDLFRRAGHRTGEAIALNSLGLAEQQLGRCSLAAEHLHAALTIFGDLGDRSGEASALDNLGTMCLRMSRNTAAAEYFARALAIFRATGERIGQARAYTGLGHSHYARGERELARRCYLRALAGYADAELPDAGLVRARLAALDSLAVDAAM
jgi:tetratricopeptide (TPR) repeat protein